jgi:integrase
MRRNSPPAPPGCGRRKAWVTERAQVLPPGTLHFSSPFLRSVYSAAVQDRLVASSPVTRLSLPRSERERIVPLTVEQLRLLAEAMPARCRAMVIAQAGSGLRVAELLALRVQDVDFLRRNVRGEWQTSPDGKRRTVPKTPRSRRTVPLPSAVAEVLALHIAQLPPADDGSLLTTPTGLLYRHEHYGARFCPRGTQGWPANRNDEPPPTPSLRLGAAGRRRIRGGSRGAAGSRERHPRAQDLWTPHARLRGQNTPSD